MDKFLGQEQPEEDRWQFIQDNADAIEEIGYTHRFTPEELAQKKEVMQEYKKQLEPLLKQKKQLLEHIKKGSEFRENEQCAKILYHDERMVGYYNKLGELVYSRPIMPQEMQKTIFKTLKTGTND